MTSLALNILCGDAKVMIACNMAQNDTKNLAGFTFYCEPGMGEPYYILNKLQFADPTDQAQVALEPARSSINAPIQKFRWLHVPGMLHQKDKVFYGPYKYTVTPRYFENGNLLPIDKTMSVTVTTEVKPFSKGDIELGFTRGFVQSQAFSNRFGKKALLKPKGKALLYDTSQQAGTNPAGESFTFIDEYQWSGFTAREKIFQIVEQVVNGSDLFLDVFAYDLNEPDLLKHFLTLGGQGRIRIILDDAPLHHDTENPKPEDDFEQQFKAIEKKQSDGQSGVIRGNFKRFQHNKIFIVSQGETRIPVTLLSGSTNFSVTGMYVNSNHVIVLKNTDVIEFYQRLFETAWKNKTNVSEFLKTDLPTKEFPFNAAGLPSMFVTFAPHDKAQALANLNKIVARMAAEQSSVLFAVMAVDPTSTGPVIPALEVLQKRVNIFSAGITDSTDSLTFYRPSSKEGILVTGKPGPTLLPPPFDQEANVGIGHQIHHKFIVCGFNTPEAVVWLGSSNLAEGGEEANGDNLIEIRDRDVATTFAIEALALIDHFHFRDKHSAPKSKDEEATAPDMEEKPIAFHLFTDDGWTQSYYKEDDLHFMDRELFMK